MAYYIWIAKNDSVNKIATIFLISKKNDLPLNCLCKMKIKLIALSDWLIVALHPTHTANHQLSEYHHEIMLT